MIEYICKSCKYLDVIINIVYNYNLVSSSLLYLKYVSKYISMQNINDNKVLYNVITNLLKKELYYWVYNRDVYETICKTNSVETWNLLDKSRIDATGYLYFISYATENDSYKLLRLIFEKLQEPINVSLYDRYFKSTAKNSIKIIKLLFLNIHNKRRNWILLLKFLSYDKEYLQTNRFAHNFPDGRYFEEFVCHKDINLSLLKLRNNYYDYDLYDDRHAIYYDKSMKVCKNFNIKSAKNILNFFIDNNIQLLKLFVEFGKNKNLVTHNHLIEKIKGEDDNLITVSYFIQKISNVSRAMLHCAIEKNHENLVRIILDKKLYNTREAKILAKKLGRTNILNIINN